MKRLGGQVISVSEATSSAKKGETIEDTVRCLECYCDALVLRHPEEGTLGRAAAAAAKPVINAGDGVGEHPTQALLDLFTMATAAVGPAPATPATNAQSPVDCLGGKTLTLLGDLKHGRTTHSLALLCSRLARPPRLVLVSPAELSMPASICAQPYLSPTQPVSAQNKRLRCQPTVTTRPAAPTTPPTRDRRPLAGFYDPYPREPPGLYLDPGQTLTSRGVVFEQQSDLSQVLATTDVLYVTRVQKVSGKAVWGGGGCFHRVPYVTRVTTSERRGWGGGVRGRGGRATPVCTRNRAVRTGVGSAMPRTSHTPNERAIHTGSWARAL
eukprot:scaffold2899_cov106-Isochrysis_galbana.AAC.7